MLVGGDEERVVAGHEFQRDAPAARDHAERVDRPGAERANAREREPRRAVLGEVEQLPDEPRHRVGLLDDDARARRRAVTGGLARDDHLCAAGDHGERCPELVRDAGGQLADRR